MKVSNDCVRKQNFWRTVCLGLMASVQAVFVPHAFAVGVYEAPCHSQNDSYLDAKKTLDECIDHLEQAAGNGEGLSCLVELNEVNEKAKLLRECRRKNR